MAEPVVETRKSLERSVVKDFVLRDKISDHAWRDRPDARCHRSMMPLSPDQATVNMILGIGYVLEEKELAVTVLESARGASFLQAPILIES